MSRTDPRSQLFSVLLSPSQDWSSLSQLNLSTLAQPGAQQLVGFGMLPDQVRDSYRNILSISSGLHASLHSRKGKSILPEDVY